MNQKQNRRWPYVLVIVLLTLASVITTLCLVSAIYSASNPKFPLTSTAFQQDLVQATRSTCEKLREAGIFYTIGFGTMLGARRYGGPVAWDDDVDLVVFRRGQGKDKIFDSPGYGRIVWTSGEI